MPIPSASFFSIFDDFYKNEKNVKMIKTWSKEWFKKISNFKVRLLYSNINNPEPFKPVTLLVDGKDFIGYYFFFIKIIII